MSSSRTRIVVPIKLAKEIDKLVGPRKRTAFLVETAENEIRRRKLLTFLDRDEPAWREKDHPEIAEHGAAAWVHRLRRERSARQAHLDELASGADR